MWGHGSCTPAVTRSDWEAEVPMETLVVLLIVAGAAAYVGRMAWRSLSAARKPEAGCGSDCGCGE
jgi:hypothetical protein